MRVPFPSVSASVGDLATTLGYHVLVDPLAWFLVLLQVLVQAAELAALSSLLLMSGAATDPKPAPSPSPLPIIRAFRFPGKRTRRVRLGGNLPPYESGGVRPSEGFHSLCGTSCHNNIGP